MIIPSLHGAEPCLLKNLINKFNSMYNDTFLFDPNA